MNEGNGGNAFISDMNVLDAQNYLQRRPTYPRAVVETIRQSVPLPISETPVAVDVGAGSGQFTELLVRNGFKVIAVEPSPAMRDVLLSQSWVAETETNVVDGRGEATGLPTGSTDVVTWAQSFHWMSLPEATEEAARILRPHGVVAAVWNQLDVRRPWVHRLTRIMRSGDVLERQRPPSFGGLFSNPTLSKLEWTANQSPEEVMELGRTRSSYIRSTPAGKAKMQDNLRWYLYDRLGFYPGESIELPYRTFVWTASKL